MKVLRYWSDAHEIKSPPGYLLRIATNESRNYHVAARNRMPHEPGWLDTLTTEDERDPAAAMADAETTQAGVRRDPDTDRKATADADAPRLRAHDL